LEAAGYEAYLVGGCVRDLLRGTEPHDWDICTSALPWQTKACFPDQNVVETGIQHGTVTVVIDGEGYEVTTYRVDGTYSDGRRPDSVQFVPHLEADLARRDFTMNAIAMDAAGRLRDPFGGAADLRENCLRCVGEPDLRFQEDGLRVMRALRFASTLGCTIEEKTSTAIHANREMLRHVAAERIHVELSKLLVGADAGQMLRTYPDVFCVFWPELAPLVTMEQNNPWHCYGGWEHTIHAVEAVRPDVVLRLTMLLHDIGKPATKTTDEHGIDHFYDHAQRGAELAQGMTRRLKFDRDTCGRVTTLVKNHGVVFSPHPKAIRRLLHKFGAENFYLLLEVSRADSMGQAREKVKDRLAELERVKAIADELIAQQTCFSLKDLAVSGQDVLAAGISPGPEVGAILNALLEQVMAEELPNERGALLQAVKAQARLGGIS
jgi:tRNA nucleotidyltransferase (CCA-adding enzyme)